MGMEWQGGFVRGGRGAGIRGVFSGRGAWERRTECYRCRSKINVHSRITEDQTTSSLSIYTPHPGETTTVSLRLISFGLQTVLN